ncbi:MAG: hypothetical protein JNK49_03625 [Planctomycetes bacterium]|nr:hypothetical protein [Planctomycetota bacterium]
MSNPEWLAHDDETGRDLFLLPISAAEAPLRLPEHLRPFVCLLVWDAAAEPVEVVSHVAESLLASGCVYLCVWGDGCSRVHDIFDEVIVGDGSRESIAAAPLVLTTWHDGESLDSALWFFLRSTAPDEAIATECRSGVAVVVGGDPERCAEVYCALKSPGDFSARMAEGSD